MTKYIKLITTVIFLAAIITLQGCAYGSITAINNNQVVIMRQDGFFWGSLRKAFVCKANTSGLTQCASLENP